MVQQLNEYIAKKKDLGNDIAGRKELIGAAKRGDIPKDHNSRPDQLAMLYHPERCFQPHAMAILSPCLSGNDKLMHKSAWWASCLPLQLVFIMSCHTIASE